MNRQAPVIFYSEQTQFEKLEQSTIRLLEIHQVDLGLDDIIPSSGHVVVPLSSLYPPLVSRFPGADLPEPVTLTQTSKSDRLGKARHYA